MSVSDKLSRLSTARNNIITKLKAKGVSSATHHGFEDFADDIDSISVGTDTSDATLNSAGQMLSGVTAYSKGTKYTGNIATKTSSDLTSSNNTVTAPAGYYATAASKTVGTAKAAATYYPSSSDQSIGAGYYTTGAQTIKAVTTTNLSAANIKNGVTVQVGDSADSDRVTSVTGTFTSDGTVTSGGQMLSGYVAYSKGTKYTGTIATKTASNLTASGKTVTVPAGYYASQVTKDVATGSATTPATTITKNPTISVNTTTGVITASVSGTQSVTPTVSAGYVISGTAGTITVSGSNTSQLTLYDGTVQAVPVNPISFTIASNPFVAESGMTWQEFIDSAFNTNGSVVAGTGNDGVFYSDGREVTLSSVQVLLSAVIQANVSYTLHGVS